MQYEIKEEHNIRYLYSNDKAIQSAIDLKNPERIVLRNLEYLMGCLMFIPEPKNILMLGVGAGSLVHFFKHFCPDSNITGIDLDAELINEMHQVFLLPQAGANLQYHIADAQNWLQQHNETYDLIIVDIFNEHCMPDWVLQKPFMQHLKTSLSDNGCVAWNTLIESEHDFTSFYSNLRLIFNQNTLCLDVEDYANTLAYSFNFKHENPDLGLLMQNAQHKTAKYGLHFHQILSTILNTNPVNAGFI
ncbi:MAG: methyltransferase domain-containing protein [Gammaproteobacteria bacterium]|nr:methyltransferase domain-containing protein [Gammaproteobacteria bacterium]